MNEVVIHRYIFRKLSKNNPYGFKQRTRQEFYYTNCIILAYLNSSIVIPRWYEPYQSTIYTDKQKKKKSKKYTNKK
jgi:hypothetical protein